jgi:hypothetical protein
MGKAKNPEMLFNIVNLYRNDIGSDIFLSLEEPFSEKEIEDVIKIYQIISLLVLMDLTMN